MPARGDSPASPTPGVDPADPAPADPAPADPAPAELTPAELTPGAPDVDQVLAEAERLSAIGHPGARSAWERLAGLPGAPAWAELKLAEIDVLELANAGRLAEPRTMFAGLAAEFTAAGAPGWGLVNAARGALVVSLTGDPAAGEQEFTEVISQVRSLPPDQADGGRHLLRVRQCQAQARLSIALGSGPDELAAVRALIQELIAQAGQLGDPARAAHLQALDASAATDPAERTALRQQAVDGLVRAGAVWTAVETLQGFATQEQHRGSPELAAEYARGALQHASGVAGPEQTGRLHALLAEILLACGPSAADEARDHALTAAGLLNGPHPLRAAWARVTAAQAFRMAGRADEAAALVADTLPVIERDGDEHDVVRARQWAGECEFDAGEFRAAALLFLSAAEVAAGWPEQAVHAELAHQAGLSLAEAGLLDESISSYDRAADVHAANGDLVSQVRALRASAWVAGQRKDGTLADGLDRMAAAADLLRQAPQEPRIQFEYVSTLSQEAELILDWLAGHRDDDATGDDDPEVQLAHRALAAADAVVAAVAAGAPPGPDDRRIDVRAQIAAAQIEALFLHEPQTAHARITQAHAAAVADGDEPTIATYHHFISWLNEELPA